MIRKIVVILAVILVLLIAYNLINQILVAFKSSDRLSAAAEKVYSLEAQNSELKKKLQEIKSPQFIEQQARDKLGLSRKGETVVIIPEQKLKEVLGVSQSAEIRFPNWQGWLKIFLH